MVSQQGDEVKYYYATFKNDTKASTIVEGQYRSFTSSSVKIVHGEFDPPVVRKNRIDHMHKDKKEIN